MNYMIDLDPTHLVLRVTITGILTDQAFRETYASVSHFAANGGPYAVILVTSGVTRNELSAETIQYVAEEPPAVPVGRPRVVVAPKPVDFGLSRMFELWRDGMRGQFHVVRSVDDAYAMLGVSAENFSRRLFPEELAA